MPDGVNIPGGPSFAGTPQPPDVPCDPTGEAWRGPPGPQGPQGINGDVISGGPFLPLSGGHVTGKLQVGATGWLEAIIPATEQFSDFVSLSNIAGPGGVFGTRTSDGGATGGMGAWAVGAFAINNNTSAVQNSYGHYTEVRRYPGAGVTEGMEIGVINEGDVKQNQPYYIAQPGSTIGLFLGAGRDDVSPNNDCSMAIGITGGNALWDRGIIFNWNSVRSQPGVGSIAVGMPPYHALVWFLNDGGASHGAGVPAAVITSNATSVSGLVHPPTLLFGNGALSFDPGDNSEAALFAVGLNTLQATKIIGTTTLVGDVSVQDGGGAEHIHLTSSNGNIATAGSLTVAGATGVNSLTVAGPSDFAATIQGTTFETYTHRVQTGGTLNTALGIYGDLSGTQTGGNSCFARVNLINDTLAAGGAGLATLLIDQHSGGTGTTGNRIGVNVNFNFAGGTTNKGLGIGSQYGGLWCYATASGNVGGTTGAGNAYGTLWGGISSATLASGATFWTAVCAQEINFGVSAGASAAYVQGLKLGLAHHAQAAQPNDFMLGMAKVYLADTAIANGIMFGTPDGYWPIASSGTLIGTLASLLATPPAMTATNGVDLSGVTLSGSAFKSSGFSVSGAGAGLINSLNVSSPAGDDPLIVTTTAAHYARVRYVGSRQYTEGVFPDGSFNLTDETGAAVRLTITSTGATTLSGHTAFGNGIDFGSVVATDANTLTRHINLYGGNAGICFSAASGFNLVTAGGGYFDFRIGGASVGNVTATGLSMVSAVQVGGGSGPTWTTGSAAPAATAPVGSLYSRVGGAVGATLYVSRGAGTWAAVAGV